MRELQDEVFDVLAHGDYPFSTLVREIGAKGRRSARDFYSVGFYFQSWLELQRSASRGGALWTEYLGEVTQEGECELVLDIHRFESTWRLFFKYDATLYKESSIVRMAERYRGLLEQMVQLGDCSLSALSLTTRRERELIAACSQGRDTARSALQGQPVPNRFLSVAAANPTRIAMRCVGEFVPE